MRLANQSAVLFEWTNQRAGYGSRDNIGREGIFWVLDPSFGGEPARSAATGNDVSGNDVSGGNDDRDRK